ncbi:MAG: hypothetical protein HQL46_01420 [Gammaproteobacteria bacterium]|nr:hypothetical protein [Gammaproteobacteria bacterium]
MKAKTFKMDNNTTDSQIQALEASFMERARQLAAEHQQHAQAEYDHYIQQQNERLQILEDKETLKAKELSDRKYRRLVQVSELNIQKKLEQLRWSLVEKVSNDAEQKLAVIAKDEPEKYLPILIQYIQHGIDILKQRQPLLTTVIIAGNENEIQLLQNNESKLQEQLDEKLTIELSSESLPSGGVIIYNSSRSIRIDMTFSGRFSLLSEKIYQLVSTLFFAEISHESEKIHAG